MKTIFYFHLMHLINIFINRRYCTVIQLADLIIFGRNHMRFLSAICCLFPPLCCSFQRLFLKTLASCPCPLAFPFTSCFFSAPSGLDGLLWPWWRPWPLLCACHLARSSALCLNKAGFWMNSSLIGLSLSDS